MLLKVKLLIAFSLFTIASYSQEVTEIKSVHPDCGDAMRLPLDSGVLKFPAPKVFGGLLEISGHPYGSIYFFHREHHTAWFILVPQLAGTQTINECECESGEFMFSVS